MGPGANCQEIGDPDKAGLAAAARNKLPGPCYRTACEFAELVRIKREGNCR